MLLEHETKQPVLGDELNEMVKKRLPGNIYSCKGIVHAAECPERCAVLHVVGRRSDVSLDEEWGDTKPRTLIVAIGTPDRVDPDLLTAEFNACTMAKMGFHKIRYLAIPV